MDSKVFNSGRRFTLINADENKVGLDRLVSAALVNSTALRTHSGQPRFLRSSNRSRRELQKR
jgi:hypothetical protein